MWGKLWLICSCAWLCRPLGSEGHEQPLSRQRLEGDLIEMSDDNNISVASDDAGDEDTIAPKNRGDEQSPQIGNDQGTKRKGYGVGKDVNENVWPQSGA